MPLTDTAIRNAKPRAKPYRLADSLGLYVLAHPNGSKYWRLKYRYGGKQKTFAVGVYPHVGLAEARRRRDAARNLLDEGKDPSAEKKAHKRTQAHKEANTFEVVFREWVEAKRGTWSEDQLEQVTRSIELNILAGLGDRPIADITAGDILSELRKIEKRGALEIAARVLQRVSATFRYAIATDRIKSNPAADLRGALKTRKVTHRPTLSLAEMPEFLSKLEAYDGHPQTKLGIKLILLTATRTAELRAAEWAEFDFDSAVWRIPAERMKMRKEHLVPLSRQALEVLELLKPITAHQRLLFPSMWHNPKPMSENAMLFALYRMGYHSRATVHGFRALFSTTLNEHGFNPDAVERALAHSERNEVRAAYNRAEYLKERRKLLQWWADYLDSLAGRG